MVDDVREIIKLNDQLKEYLKLIAAEHKRM